MNLSQDDQDLICLAMASDDILHNKYKNLVNELNTLIPLYEKKPTQQLIQNISKIIKEVNLLIENIKKK